MLPASPLAWTASWATLGLFVGSFLNVCIHRYAIPGESVRHPRRSRCPSCRATLSWRENVPLLSWLVQGGRCRHCGWRIPVRYPLVELANAALWTIAIAGAGAERWPLWVTWSIALSGLLVATVVDFDHFEIPDGVSIGGMVLAPVVCLLVPELHADTAVARSFSAGGAGSVDRIGALVGCVSGMAVGGGVLLAIGWVGKRVYHTEAMGFGDVKLLAAGGGLVGPGGALAALMIGAVTASAFGIANMLRFLWISRARARSRGRRDRLARSARVARTAGRYLPFGPFLALGIAVVLLRWPLVQSLARTSIGWGP